MAYNDTMFIPPWPEWSNDFISTEKWDQFLDVCRILLFMYRHKYKRKKIWKNLIPKIFNLFFQILYQVNCNK